MTKTTPNTIRDIHNNNNVVRGDKYTSEFLEWWDLYPRKDGSRAELSRLEKGHKQIY